MRKGQRRIGAAAVTVALLIGAAACGGSAKNTGAAGKSAARAKKAEVILSTTADSTTAAKTMKFSLSVTITAKNLPDTRDGTGKITGGGAFDFVARRGTFALDLTGMKSMTTSDTSGAEPSLDRIELVLDGDAIYVRVPAGMETGGKSWIKMTGGAGTGAPGPFGQLGKFDVTSLLDTLKSAKGEQATEVGPEKINGVDTTHYRLEIDLSKMAESMTSAPTTTPEEAKLLAGLPPIPADIWIDAGNRLRRLTVSMDATKFVASLTEGLSALGGTGITATTETIPSNASLKVDAIFDVSDYGSPVEVTVPPADQVADLSQMLQGMLQGVSTKPLP